MTSLIFIAFWVILSISPEKHQVRDFEKTVKEFEEVSSENNNSDTRGTTSLVDMRAVAAKNSNANAMRNLK